VQPILNFVLGHNKDVKAQFYWTQNWRYNRTRAVICL